MTDPPGLGREQRRAELAARLRSVRLELDGEGEGREFARRVGVPWRAWAGYEAGSTIPGDVMLAFLEATGAEPAWLLRGEGPTYRARPRRGEV